MTIPFFSPSAPLVIAHRGASSEEPENTIAAFLAAVRAGADAVELDVRLTADGVPVVLHDEELSITTDGSGPVHARTLAEVKRLDAARGRGMRQEIPTLAEVLEALAVHDVAVDIEVKAIPGELGFEASRETLLEATLEVLGASRFGGAVMVSSFDLPTLERSRALRPDLPTGVLTVPALDPRSALTYARGAGHAAVLPAAPAVLEAGPGLAKECREAGIGLFTWTVDDEDTLARLFSWGLDGVATNRPGMAVAVRDRVAGRTG